MGACALSASDEGMANAERRALRRERQRRALHGNLHTHKACLSWKSPGAVTQREVSKRNSFLMLGWCCSTALVSRTAVTLLFFFAVYFFSPVRKYIDTLTAQYSPVETCGGTLLCQSRDGNNANDPTRLNSPRTEPPLTLSPSTSTPVGAPSANRQSTIVKPGE